MYLDLLDKTDGGVNSIEVNPWRHTIYLSTAYQLTSTGPVTGRVYRGSYNPYTGDVDDCWSDITGNLPNKVCVAISSNASKKGSL
ncbi:MAG: hypothetical protein IPO27_17560 [Bacteroidetes bacterium]|nr:hypothetical protein [Bacteroidota bacterium]